MAVSVLVIKTVMLMEMVLDRLHFDDEISSSSINIGWVEDTTVCFKGSTLLLPSVLVEFRKVISPLEIEFILLVIVAVDLDIVEK